MYKISHYFFATAGVSLFLGIIFWYRQSKKSSSSKSHRPHMRRRKGDSRNLSKPERKALRRAKILKTKGNPNEGARILVAAKLYREAVHLLEKADLIHDAAKILFKLKKPERAAAIYARHHYWQDSANAYRKSNMPREAAKSYLKGGDFENAAECFYKAGMFNESAEAAVAAGNVQRAIKVFLAAGQQQKAIELMVNTIRSAGKDAMPALNSYEQQLIAQHALHREINIEIVDLLNQYGQTVDVTAELLRYGDKEKSAFILRRMGKGLVSPVVQKLGTQSSACMTLADLLRELGHFEEAGAVLEQMQLFDRAAEAFILARNNDRAAYCSNKARELTAEEVTAEVEAKVQPAFEQEPEETRANQFEISRSTLEETPHTKVTPPPPVMAAIESRPTTEAALPPPPLALSEESATSTLASQSHFELESCQALSQLDSRDREGLLALGSEICYPAQETLFDQKLPPTGLMLVKSGYISLFDCFSGAGSTVSNSLGAGELLGLKWVLLDEKERYRAVTSDDTKILVIPKEAALEFLSTHKAAAASLYKLLCEDLHGEIKNSSNFSPLKQVS